MAFNPEAAFSTPSVSPEVNRSDSEVLTKAIQFLQDEYIQKQPHTRFKVYGNPNSRIIAAERSITDHTCILIDLRTDKEIHIQRGEFEAYWHNMDEQDLMAMMSE